jgi:RNA polymerase sigma-70 factor (ECF subfamily)
MGHGSVTLPSEQGPEPAGGLEAGPGPCPGPTFAELYETYFTFVWRSARRLGTPEANLDDVVQEIFMVAFRRRDEFEGRSSVKTWLYGIVFNVVRAHRRELAQKHPQVIDGERRADAALLVDRADGPQEVASKREAARVIDRFLDSLDDDRRAVFVLAELEQLTAPEIAAIVGAPLNTVYSRLRLARIDFAKAISRHRARDVGRKP